METKAREFWIAPDEEIIYDEEDIVKYGIDKSRYTHVVEYSAIENFKKRIDAIEAENKKLREALGFYANWANWKDGKICETDITPVEFHGSPNFFQDIGGKRARQALGEVGE